MAKPNDVPMRDHLRSMNPNEVYVADFSLEPAHRHPNQKGALSREQADIIRIGFDMADVRDPDTMEGSPTGQPYLVARCRTLVIRSIGPKHR